MNKGQPFMHVEADTGDAPTFSEAFLYETVGKGDARFILGVAEEYEHIIEALGPTAVKSILAVKPSLVNRLATGEKIIEWLKDARDENELWHEERYPSQVIIDNDAAKSVWSLLHEQYCRFFNPEESMPEDQLRLYHMLTDRLGSHYQEKRKKEQDRLPEKLVKQKERKAEIAAKREKRRAEAEAANS